jgi:hypothetical protein
MVRPRKPCSQYAVPSERDCGRIWYMAKMEIEIKKVSVIADDRGIPVMQEA